MSAYHENEDVRIRIDKRLKANAARQANLGAEDIEEVDGAEKMREAKEQAKKDWENDLIEIAKLDPEFAYSLHAQTD